MTSSTHEGHPFVIQNMYTSKVFPVEGYLLLQPFFSVRVYQNVSQRHVSRNNVTFFIIKVGTQSIANSLDVIRLEVKW